MNFDILFDEQFYLESYSDVEAAVAAGQFSSGRQHFEEYGLEEGRTLISPYYDEGTYLRKYPDIAEAVVAGFFPSGLAHYIQFGEAEGRSGSAFSEEVYLLAYPDVAAVVEAGDFSSGLEHYIEWGQFEGRGAVFTGTSGSDIITGFGEATVVIGVDLFSDDITNSGTPQVDILTGGDGLDLFLLNDFYVGGGSSDYAVIQNFDPFNDLIGFTGVPEDYTFQAVDGNTNILTTSGDFVASVQGVTNLTVLSSDPFSEVFIVG